MAGGATRKKRSDSSTTVEAAAAPPSAATSGNATDEPPALPTSGAVQVRLVKDKSRKPRTKSKENIRKTDFTSPPNNNVACYLSSIDHYVWVSDDNETATKYLDIVQVDDSNKPKPLLLDLRGTIATNGVNQDNQLYLAVEFSDQSADWLDQVLQETEAHIKSEQGTGRLVAACKKPFRTENSAKVDVDPALFSKVNFSSVEIGQGVADAEIYLKLSKETPILEFESAPNEGSGLLLVAEPAATKELGLSIDSKVLESASVRLITKMACRLIMDLRSNTVTLKPQLELLQLHLIDVDVRAQTDTLSTDYSLSAHVIKADKPAPVFDSPQGGSPARATKKGKRQTAAKRRTAASDAEDVQTSVPSSFSRRRSPLTDSDSEATTESSDDSDNDDWTEAELRRALKSIRKRRKRG